jgi:hypothetical protein
VAAGLWETIANSRQDDALQAQEAIGRDPWQIGKTNAARGLQAETMRGDPHPGCCFASADSGPPMMYVNVVQNPGHPDPRGARQTGDLSCERAESPYEGLRCSGGAEKRNSEHVAWNPRRSSQPLPLDVSLSLIGLMSY